MHWEGIRTKAFEDLEKHVQECVPCEKKETYQEKASREFALHVVAEKYDAIEEALWSSGYAPVRQSVHSALQHRFCFIYLTSGLLRSESLWHADLSDFFSLRIPDCHPMYLMINMIAIGKTTH